MPLGWGRSLADTPAVITNELGALRIRTSHQGMHRLTYDDLLAADPQSVTIHPDNFAMTYLDQPIQIQVIGGEDGSFDPGDLVLFYARVHRPLDAVQRLPLRMHGRRGRWVDTDGHPNR